MLPNPDPALAWNCSLLQVRLRDIATALEEEFPLSGPFLPQALSDTNELFAFDVVKHDDVGSSIDGLVSLLFGANLNI
jgi:hypothetical protein